MHKIGKMYDQKCFDNNNDISFALFQIRSMPVGAGLPSPASLLSSMPIRPMLLQVNREPINCHTDDENYRALKL